MAERTSVICDIHTKDHPATHFGVAVDMCDAAFAKYQARVEGDGQDNRTYNLEQDNRRLLTMVLANPGGPRGEYQDTLGWDQKRVVNAYNRLRKLGLVQSKGVGQGGRWHPTAAGKRTT